MSLEILAKLFYFSKHLCLEHYIDNKDGYEEDFNEDAALRMDAEIFLKLAKVSEYSVDELLEKYQEYSAVDLPENQEYWDLLNSLEV